MEKIMKIITALIFVSFLGFPVCASSLFLDNDFKKYEDEYWIAYAECINLKTNREKTPCEEKHSTKFANDPRKRGSETYFEKHYKSLDFETLDHKFLELKVLQKKAPRISAFDDRPHGVVSQAILEAEMRLIYALQAERQHAMKCEEEKRSIEAVTASMNSMSPTCKQYFAEKAIEERLNSQ